MENPPPLETQPAPQKPRRLLIVGAALLVVLWVAAASVYAWFALYGPCGRGDVKTATTALLDNLKAYEQAYEAATLMGPIGLVGPVTQLEQTLLSTRELVVPVCMQAAKNELATSIESAIRAYLAVMNQQPDKTFQKPMKDSKTHLENFATELDAVNRCAPFCL